MQDPRKPVPETPDPAPDLPDEDTPDLPQEEPPDRGVPEPQPEPQTPEVM